MKCIIGKKISNSRIFDKAGKVIPVTLVTAGPCVVTSLKTNEKDGYQAVQLGFNELKKSAKAKKTSAKALKKFRHYREFKFNKAIDFKVGDKITVEQFKEGDKVEAMGKSKGKGYQGVVKRHGFKGGPASHGHRHVLRKPGSIGCRFPQHTVKGMKMAGRMGGDNITIKGLAVVKVDPKASLIAIKGSLPGMRGSLVFVKSR